MAYGFFSSDNNFVFVRKNRLTLFFIYGIIPSVPMMRLLRDGTHADVAELADALDSGSSDRKVMQVQVLSSA